MNYLYIVRHGETEWNVQQRMQGRLDSPLTSDGRGHAQANGELIRSLGGVEQLFVSPSGRTTETAFIINSHTKCAIEYFDELMERDCGDWSGMTIDEIAEQYPKAWAERDDDPYFFKPPGGENLRDMLERCHEFLESLYASEFEHVALVTHGVMSKVILQYYLGLNEVQTTKIRHPNNLVYRLTFTAQDIETEHFLDGGMPRPGLLYQQQEPIAHKT